MQALIQSQGCGVVMAGFGGMRKGRKEAVDNLGFSEEAMHTIASNAGCTLKAYHRMQPRIDAKGPSLFTAILEVAH